MTQIVKSMKRYIDRRNAMDPLKKWHKFTTPEKQLNDKLTDDKRNEKKVIGISGGERRGRGRLIQWR